MLYRVDYSDPAFPRIRTTDIPGDGKTFSAAKAELIENIRYSYEHWREQMRAARAVTRKSVTEYEQA